MNAAYNTLLYCYIQPDYIKMTGLSLMQYRNENNFLKLNQIGVGGKCMVDLSKVILPAPENFFLTNRLNFFVEGARQHYKRFSLNSNYVKSLKVMQFLELNNSRIKKRMKKPDPADRFLCCLADP